MADHSPTFREGEAATQRAAQAPDAAKIRRDPASATLAAGISILATIIGLIFLAWLVLFVTKGRFLKHTFERIVSAQTQREVKVAGDFQLYLNPVNVKFLAEGLTVSNPSWAGPRPFFQSRVIDTNIATIPFLFGTKRINWLSLDQGRIDLEWDRAGKRNTWTFGDPDAPGKPLEIPVIRRALLAGTQLRYRDPKMQLNADIAFQNIAAANTRFASDIRFSGDGSLRGKPFTLSGGLLSPNETLAGGRNRLTLHAQASSTVLDVSGTLPGATQIEGADLRVAVRGQNIARLFDLIGVVTPDTRSYRITSQLTKRGDEWRFTRLAGRFGDSDIAGRMTVAMPVDRVKLNADLASRSVSIVDIGPFIGYNPDAIATKGAAGAVTQVNGTPRLLPDAPLRIEAIRNFDAKVNYRVRTIAGRNIPISNVSLTLDLDHSLLKLSPLSFDMARGHLDSDISINARVRPVVTDYDVRLAPTPMGILLAGWGVEESGTSGTLRARVQMRGLGDTVRESLGSANGRIAIVMPRGTLWTRNIQLAELDIGTFIWKMFEQKLKRPVQINCGLIAFTVRNGVAAADPILIDTDKNVILGRGGFSFRDESVDLAFRADSKKFSLFSGQSPVGIGGHFAAPSLKVISPELLARAGAGLGLVALVNPLAGVLAFVDVGDAKSAACGPVLGAARASAMRDTKGRPRNDVGNGRDAHSR